VISLGGQIMGIEENKKIVLDAYASLSRGEPEGFYGVLSDDVEWTFFGSHRYAGTFKGRSEIETGLFGSLGELLEGPIKVHVKHVIAEGDKVVIVAKGEAKALNGKDYNNDYCIVVTVQDGKITEMQENLDSELVTDVFGKG
jgi:uncharacterized protein